MDKIMKILEDVLFAHHDDISKQDENAIEEARQQIYEIVKGYQLKKKVMTYEYCNCIAENICKECMQNRGFNSAISLMNENIEREFKNDIAK